MRFLLRSNTLNSLSPVTSSALRLFASAAAKQSAIDRLHQPELHGTSRPSLTGHYDLVTCFEALHDMNDPVGALQTILRPVKEDGTVLIVDERVGDTFTAKGNDVEWMMYGWSILHCLPVGMTDEDAAGTGTVMRESVKKLLMHD